MSVPDTEKIQIPRELREEQTALPANVDGITFDDIAAREIATSGGAR